MVAGAWDADDDAGGRAGADSPFELELLEPLDEEDEDDDEVLEVAVLV